jgi:hypothetical protein
MTVHALEVMPDHVHLFVESDPARCVAEIVNPSRLPSLPPGQLDELLPDVWFASHPSARRKTAA